MRASINLANDLRLGTIAEGIEDDDTARALARLGCNEMQGYLVSRPVAAHDFLRWARSWNPLEFAARIACGRTVRPATRTPNSSTFKGWIDAVPNLTILDEGSLETPGTTLRWWDVGLGGDADDGCRTSTNATRYLDGLLPVPRTTIPYRSTTPCRVYIVDGVPGVVGVADVAGHDIGERGAEIMNLILGELQPVA